MADYTFPAFLNKPLQSTFSRVEGGRFSATDPASGAYIARIDTDDVACVFNVSFTFGRDEALAFRAWQRIDNYAVLNGAQFNIDIYVEGGFVTQVASFTPDGIPQQTSVNAEFYNYSATIIVQRMVEIGVGSEELIIGAVELGGFDLLDEIVNNELPGA